MKNQITVRLPEPLRVAVEKRAHENDQTISDFVRLLIIKEFVKIKRD